MNDLVQYFGAAYLINLSERTDRLRSATKELARAGWTLGPGGVEHYAAQRFADAAGFPFPQSRGCFHSHSECIRAAHLQGKRGVLVMEDDIALPSSIGALTPSIISKLDSTPWDFVYLGHEYLDDRMFEMERANSRTTEIEFAPLQDPVTTAHFYAVNQRIFPKLLEHLDRIASGTDQEFGPMPIDGAFHIFRQKNPDVRGLVAIPKLGWQRSSRSDNHPRFYDSFRTLRPLIRVLRDAKYIGSRWRS